VQWLWQENNNCGKRTVSVAGESACGRIAVAVAGEQWY
jgi:hypothetical protein